jgi:hypothetical protein
MPKNLFDELPPADPKAFRKTIKRNLAKALRSLAKFSDSVRAGRTPDWPPEATYALFMAQLRHFQLISKRKEKALPIQLMREIDHRWRGLKVVKTVGGCVKQLQNYMGNTLLGSAIAKARFKRRNDPAKDRLVSLVFKGRLAGPEDLDAMRHLLPESFQHLDILLSSKFVKRATEAPDDTVQKLRAAVARSAQEYLWSEHKRFREKSAAAARLREFIFGLDCRQYQKKLFGFSRTQIAEWHKIDRRETNRVRQERFRQNKRAKKALRSR